MVNGAKTWDFTISKKDIPIQKVKKSLREIAENWAFQWEIGKKSGHHHYQGRCKLKWKSTKKQARGHFKKVGLKPHLSPTSRANVSNNFYVMKEETRHEGPWQDTDPVIPDWIVDLKLRPWQQMVVDSLKVPDKEMINVIYDPLMTGLGKSTLFSYCGINQFAQCIPPLDTSAQIVGFAMCWGEKPAYIIDMPKGALHSQEIWRGIETIKSGYLYDWRNKARQLHMYPPVIWVFSNTVPKLEWLAARKWKFWMDKDGNKQELVVVTLNDINKINIRN